MPKLAREVRFEHRGYEDKDAAGRVTRRGTTRHLFVDGEEFPWYTTGARVVEDIDGLKCLAVTIPLVQETVEETTA